MRQLPRTLALAVALAAIFCSASACAAVHIPLGEDIDFGCGLVERGYHGLGVTQLEARLPEITSNIQKRRVYNALATGNRALARSSRADLTAAEDKARRQAYQDAANKYRALLRDMGVAAASSLKDLMRLAEQAKTLHRELRLTPPSPEKDRLLRGMMDEFEAIIAGIETLHKTAAAAVAKKEEEDNGSLTTPKLKAWQAAITTLREKDLFAGIDLNRVRYWYSKALPATEAARKAKLLADAIEGLDDYVNSYGEWLYSIVGNEMLARARMETGDPEEGIRASEAGLELIRAYVRMKPGARVEMRPWDDRLTATRVLGYGKLGQFNRAIALGGGKTAPVIELAVAEVMLLKATHYRGKKGLGAQAVVVQQRAERSLKTLAGKGQPWEALAAQLLDKYDPRGVSFVALLTQFQLAVRARDNAGVIDTAAQLLALDSDLPADRRSAVLARLAPVYRQERMYYEAYIVYRHIAAITNDDKDAETAARRAVDALKMQYDATKDAADGELLDGAKEWRRENFSGPGIEYERAAEQKKRREFKAAISGFALVKESSLYFDSALEQIGECYILLAKELEKTKPDEAEKNFELGRQTLLRFLDKIKEPTRLPRVIRRRRLFQAAAQYRLATAYMRKGKEDYERCLAVTKDYIKQFPDSTMFHPYAMLLRLRALVETKQLQQAEVDLVAMQQACAAMKDTDKAGTLGSYATDLLSNAHVTAAGKLRDEAGAKEADAVKADEAGDAARAAALRRQAAALKTKATAHASKALTIMMSAVAANPNLPFDKYYSVIAELHFQGRFNELTRYLSLFIDRFAGKKGLTKKQSDKVDIAHVMLGEAYFESGQFKQAYDVCVERLETLGKIGEGDEPPPEYWLLQKHIGLSAQHLAKAASDPEKKRQYIATAIDKYLELRSRLKKGSPDWWQVTIGAVETQNIAGRHADNLVVIKRTLATRPGLGGGAFRQRYVRVLEEMCMALKDNAGKAKAVGLLMEVLTVDLEQLQKDKKCSEILDAVRSLGTASADYGGLENRRKLRVFVTFAMKEAKEEETSKDAERLLQRLKD